MSDRSKIEWCDTTWNVVTGCTKVSQGCKNCYAETVAKRFWGERKFTEVGIHYGRLEQPMRWRKPRRVFVNSMSDLFHEDVPDSFIERVWFTMIHAHQHTFMILTKRPKRMQELVSRFQTGCMRNGIPDENIWLGVSVENQQNADERIPYLLQTPAAVRFVSCEPLLGPVELKNFLPSRIPLPRFKRDGELIVSDLDWVICGGESGPRARPMHPDWARSLRDQCVAAGVPFFFKQHGEWTTEYPQGLNMAHREQTYLNGQSYFRVGKKIAGRLLDGREWNEYPKEDRHD